MDDLFGEAHVLYLRVRENFVNHVDGRVGNAIGVNPGQPVFTRLFALLLTQE